MQRKEESPIVRGTIMDILNNGHPPSPWLQISQTRAQQKEPCMICLSDTQHQILAKITAPGLIYGLEQKTVELYDIVQISQYVLKDTPNGKCLQVTEFRSGNVIKHTELIGNPTSIYKSHEGVEPAGAQPRYTTTNTTPSNYWKDSAPSFGSNTNNPTTTMPPPQSTFNSSTNRPMPAYSSNTIPNQNVSNPYQQTTRTTTQSSTLPFSTTLTHNQPASFPPNHHQPPPPSSSALYMGHQQGGDANEDLPSIQPIMVLNPYQNKWAIKARITSKTEIKKFANQRGEGKLFSCTCIDDSGEIRMTAFGEAVDKFYDLIQEGQVYLISNAPVKIARKPYNTKHDYEIHLETSSLVTLVREDNTIPKARFVFKPLSAIADLQKDDTCDVIGIVKEAGELSSIVTKTTGRSLSKRDLTLVDQTHHSIKVTLWGTQAEHFDCEPSNHPVLALRDARVSDYNGRTLSTSAGTAITLNPDIREAHQLRGWFDSQGMHEPFTSLSTIAGPGGASAMSGWGSKDERKLIKQIKDEGVGMGEKADYFSLLATIVYIRTDLSISYTACPVETCNKKVVEEGPGIWHCERCQKRFDRCEHRYLFNAQISDHTGQVWLNLFNETGLQLLGRTAEEMYYMRMSDEAAYTAVLKEALFKQYLFRVRARQENFQGGQKVRFSVLSLLPPNYVEESKAIIDKIERYF